MSFSGITAACSAHQWLSPMIIQVYLIIFFCPSLAEAAEPDPSSGLRYLTSCSGVVLLGCLVVTLALLVCFCLRKLIFNQETDQEITMARQLDKKVFLSFPNVTFRQEGENGCTECHICLEEFTEGEKLRALPVCSHIYHDECILRWMITRDSRCPDCRHDYRLGLSNYMQRGTQISRDFETSVTSLSV